MDTIAVNLKLLSKSANVPSYQTFGASGCDVSACIDAPLTVAPGARLAVPTGLAFEIPEGFEIQVRPRSGLALKQGLTVLNAPGTIDSDYRGELKVILVNLGQEPVVIHSGDRIAQLVLAEVPRMQLQVVEILGDSARGEGGFGSTGKEAKTPPLSV